MPYLADMHGRPALFSVEMQERIGEGAEGKWEGGAGNREGRGNRVKNNSDNNLKTSSTGSALPEDLGSISSTYMSAKTVCNSTLWGSSAFSGLCRHRTQVVHRHTQIKYSYTKITNIFFKVKRL